MTPPVSPIHMHTGMHKWIHKSYVKHFCWKRGYRGNVNPDPSDDNVIEEFVNTRRRKCIRICIERRGERKQRWTSGSDNGLHCMSCAICSSTLPCVLEATRSTLIFFFFWRQYTGNGVWNPNPRFWLTAFERERARKKASERFGKHQRERNSRSFPIYFLSTASKPTSILVFLIANLYKFLVFFIFGI